MAARSVRKAMVRMRFTGRMNKDDYGVRWQSGAATPLLATSEKRCRAPLATALHIYDSPSFLVQEGGKLFVGFFEVRFSGFARGDRSRSRRFFLPGQLFQFLVLE